MSRARFEHSLPEFKGGYATATYCPPHFHTHLEILSPVRGSVNTMVNRELYTLKGGDCVVILPGSIHSHLESSPDNSMLFMVFSLRYAGEYSKLMQNSYARRPVILEKDLHPDAKYVIKALLRELYKNQYQTAKINTALIKSLLHLFFTQTLPQLELSDIQDQETQNLTNRLLVYLSREYAGPVRLADVADEFGVSQYKVSRIFANQLNMSFNQYLNTLRVEQAKKELRDSREKITYIAHGCGFSSVRTFNRAFQDITGTTPSKYRQLQTGGLPS